MLRPHRMASPSIFDICKTRYALGSVASGASADLLPGWRVFFDTAWKLADTHRDTVLRSLEDCTRSCHGSLNSIGPSAGTNISADAGTSSVTGTQQQSAINHNSRYGQVSAGSFSHQQNGDIFNSKLDESRWARLRLIIDRLNCTPAYRHVSHC